MPNNKTTKNYQVKKMNDIKLKQNKFTVRQM